MKKTYLITLLILMVSTAFAQTQRFPRAASFGTNVFLHDSTTPLHLRVPTGIVVSAFSSPDGSLSITTTGTAVSASVSPSLVVTQLMSGIEETSSPTNGLVIRAPSSSSGGSQGNNITIIPGGNAAGNNNDGHIYLSSGGTSTVIDVFSSGVTLYGSGSSGIGLYGGNVFFGAQATNKIIFMSSTGDFPFRVSGFSITTGGVAHGLASGLSNIPAQGITGALPSTVTFPVSLQTVSAFNNWSTNALKAYYPGTPTNGQTGARGEAHVNTTNLVLFLGGTNKFVMTGVLNP